MEDTNIIDKLQGIETARADIRARKIQIGQRVKIGKDCRIVTDEVSIGSDVTIGDDFSFEGNVLHLESKSTISDNVRINVKQFTLGYKSKIEANARLAAIRGQGESVKIGDYTLIGHDLTCLIPELVIGDYCAVHNHLLINGYAPCRLGHNCYVGQHSVLNASDELTIGNNVRLALNGYIWTHVESGELLEGCNFYGRAPVTIEDNVWLTGCNISISPGVTLKNGSIILHGSVVTKSTAPRHCYSGVPAMDVTEKLKPYREVTLVEKYDLMRKFAGEFIDANPEYKNAVTFCERFPHDLENNNKQHLIIAKYGETVDFGGKISSFSLEKKTYTKKRTELEEAFIRFHLGCRARFIPDSEPSRIRK